MKAIFCILFLSIHIVAIAQTVKDNFEGAGTITTWFGDTSSINSQFLNPFKDTLNNSATVLKYTDTGALYANVRFDVSTNFVLASNASFSLKIYVPSSSISGNSNKQISLKLQNGKLSAPWSTQSEIIKTIQFNTWQTINFDFKNDAYLNLNTNSKAPTLREDFNRVVLQVNGENNKDEVVAYIDDFVFNGTLATAIDVNTNSDFTKLVWSDEFEGNGVVNSEKWFHQTKLPNGNSWYNGEVQHYTDRLENTYKENGVLIIAAKKEAYTNQGVTKQYTSARLNSKFAFKYGRVEVRAKLPTGVGTWPAIWMLGKNIIETGGYWSSSYGTKLWPDCGEVDIMEHWGSNQNFVQSAMHTPSSYGGTVNHGGQTIATASSAFHVYSLEWTKEYMRFMVDNVVHYIYHPQDKNDNTWPFNKEQYLLLNVAIQPSIATNFIASKMEVDYVRVYQAATASIQENALKAQVALFPNPVTSNLNIVIPVALLNSKALLFSIEGKLLKEIQLEQTRTMLPMAALQKGIYLLKMVHLNGSFSYKVLKM